MKQPEDTRTGELDAGDDWAVPIVWPKKVKRGRGRPRKPNALTPAQRAKRYCARKLFDSLRNTAKRIGERASEKP